MVSRSQRTLFQVGILMSIVYDGGIQMVTPGMTHLGRPMQILKLGRTSLPMDIIMDYLDSMRPIYTAEV
jgi:desumoylating isopeptidase 1